MIPKKIHYCWFGKASLPDSVQRCMESWKKFCPDYEIVEWNEENFDPAQYPYTKEAYEAKKWAFVSDVARLHALICQGGVYLDTDVELLGPLDSLLNYEGVVGFETEEQIGAGFIACRPGNLLMQRWLDTYKQGHFLKADGTLDLTPCVERLTALLAEDGLKKDNRFQIIDGCAVFPKEVFSPKDMETGKIVLTKNSLAVHHYDGSWLSKEEKLAWKLGKKLGKVLPLGLGGYLGKFLAVCRYRGLKEALQEVQAWQKRKSGREKQA